MSEVRLTEFRAIKKTEKGTVYIAIEHPPTIDAVEVVRCGNCRNGRVDRVNHGYGAPYRVDCRALNRMMYDHDFCSFGKRKEPDHE